MTATAERRERLVGLACGLVVVAVWSNFIVLSRLGAVGALNAFDLAALRFGVSGAIMLPVLCRLGFGGLGAGQVALVTLTAGPLFALFAYAGFSLAPAQHGAVLLPGTLPLFTAALAWAALGERLGRARLACLGLIVLGVACLALEGLGGGGGDRGARWGDLLFPAGSLSWAVFTVASRAWRLSPLRATAIVSVLSMALYLPVYALFLPSNLLAAPPGEVAFQGVFQGVFAVIVALLAYTRAVAALGPAVTTMITAVVPGAAALWAVPVLGETLSPATGAGLVLVTLGMLGAVLSVAPLSWPAAARARARREPPSAGPRER